MKLATRLVGEEALEGEAGMRLGEIITSMARDRARDIGAGTVLVG